MASVKPIKPVDRVAFELLMCELSKARAMAWTLEELGAPGTVGNNLQHAMADAPRPQETHEWLHSVVAEALHSALDEIEREYRKLGTNLLAKEAADLQKPKDGA
jgi:hypothetical protein